MHVSLVSLTATVHMRRIDHSFRSLLKKTIQITPALVYASMKCTAHALLNWVVLLPSRSERPPSPETSNHIISHVANSLSFCLSTSALPSCLLNVFSWGRFVCRSRGRGLRHCFWRPGPSFPFRPGVLSRCFGSACTESMLPPSEYGEAGVKRDHLLNSTWLLFGRAYTVWQ